MKAILCSLLCVMLVSCNYNPLVLNLTYVATLPCDRKQAREMAEEFMLVKGSDLGAFDTKETEDSLHYIISYSCKNINILDCGTTVIVRKDRCAISKIYDGYAVITFITDAE